MAFLVQGLIAATIWMRFKKLSEKRKKKQITEDEKWEQAIYSVPAKPILETILSKDPVGMRVIFTACLVTSSLITVVLTSSDGLIIVMSIVLLGAIWLSLDTNRNT